MPRSGPRTPPDVEFVKRVVFVNGAVPVALTAWDAAHHHLGANPIEFITRTTGTLTLLFLVLTLAVTPARKLLGIPWLGRVRRMLGLYAFFYGTLHFLTYVWLDQFFDLRAIAMDVFSRPFVSVGMLSFFFMIPLAVTSTNAAIKRLGGKRWSRLHKRTYAIAIGGVAHFALLVKADLRRPLIFGVLVALLLGYRVVGWARSRSRADGGRGGAAAREGN